MTLPYNEPDNWSIQVSIVLTGSNFSEPLAKVFHGMHYQRNPELRFWRLALSLYMQYVCTELWSYSFYKCSAPSDVLHLPSWGHHHLIGRSMRHKQGPWTTPTEASGVSAWAHNTAAVDEGQRSETSQSESRGIYCELSNTGTTGQGVESHHERSTLAARKGKIERESKEETGRRQRAQAKWLEGENRR